MFEPELTEFLNIHAGLGLAKVTRSIRVIAHSEVLDLPQSVREHLLVSTNFMELVSNNAMDLAAVDVWKNSTQLGKHAEIRAKELKYPSLGNAMLV
ncbi:MAG: hypothetical protein DI533_17270 [Cereibacter sphaeroides]|uniref:Uncharacterized protein n=1 Tax=Cereibacter sphaeroides TaxID=1063 RepID=A0A2W5SAL0_CERSP|nr:MAG: hypothetical protein DI533_17270 [Cereibacter sphaeroides]